MKKVLMAFLLTIGGLFVTFNQISSMDSRQNFRVMADFQCSEVLDRNNDRQITAYVEGYTTATNVWLPGKTDHFKGMSIDSILNWIRERCRTNSLGTLGAALTSMVSELL